MGWVSPAGKYFYHRRGYLIVVFSGSFECLEFTRVFSTWLDWALVSEPGFLKFQISRFSILEILLWRNIFEKYVGEISRNK